MSNNSHSHVRQIVFFPFFRIVFYLIFRTGFNPFSGTLRVFQLVIGIAEHVSDIHVSANIQKVKLKNVGQIQKSMGPFEKMPLL